MKTKVFVFNTHPRAVLRAILFASIAPLLPASAGTIWDGGGGDNNWGTGANWAPDGAPTAGSAVDLTFDGSVRLTPFNNLTPFAGFRSILFAPTAHQFDVRGNAIDLFGKIENNGTITQTVSLEGLSIQAGQAGTGQFNPVNGDLVINSTNIFTNGNAVRISGGNNRRVTFGAGTVISQGGEFIIEQANTVVFQSGHTYTGDTLVKAGTLEFAAGGSADFSTIHLGGVDANSGAATIKLSEPMGGQWLSSSIVVRPSSSGSQGLRTIASENTGGTNMLSGEILLDADLRTNVAEGGNLAFIGPGIDLRNQTLTVSGGGNTSIGGLHNSTGSGKVTKTGAGTLTLSGTNTFSGALTVEDGTLAVSQWNADGTDGPLGNSLMPVTLGGASTMGTLRYTGGGANNAPSTIKGLNLAAGGGKVEMVYTEGNRNQNYIHIDGNRLTGSGGLTVDTIAGGAGSRFIVVGSASYTGPTVVTENSELQTNYSTVGVDGTPFGAGLNGLGSAVTVESGARLTFFSFGNDATVALGSLSGSGIVQGEGNGTHTFKIGGDNSNTTFSGLIQNNGGGRTAITKVGSGTLTLSGANTYTGLTAIESGAISVSEWNLSGAAGPWGISNNNQASPGTTFIQMSGGRVNYTGPSAGGALRGVNLVSGDNTIDVIAGSTLNFSGGSNTFQSNGGNLIKEGGGTLQIGAPSVANNIFTGKASINAGTLEWFGAGSMPVPPELVEDFITINNGGTLQLSYAEFATIIPANIGFKVSGNASIRIAGTHTIQSVIGDGASAGSFTKKGAGHLLISGVNTYTGTLTIEEGMLSTAVWNNNGVDGPLGNSNNAVVLGGATTQGTLRYSGPAFLPDDNKKGFVLNPGGGKVQLAMGSSRASYAHLNGSNITGSGGLTVETGGARFIVIESTSYTGPTVVGVNSELQTNYTGLGDGTPFGAGTNGLGSAVTLNAGAFLTFYSNNAQSGPIAIGSLSGEGTVRGEGSGTHLFKIGGDGTSTAFSGVIMDSFNAANGPTALSKVGPGTLTLSGQSSYTGATTVDAGTLSIQGSISGSAVTVNGGALSGNGGMVGPTTVNAGGTLAPGSGIGTLTFSDSLFLAGHSVFEINKSGLELTADLASVTGVLTLGGTLTVTASGDALALGDTFNLFDADAFLGDFTSIVLPALANAQAWDTSNLAVDGSIAVIPEPGVACSLLGGLGILAARRRRRA